MDETNQTAENKEETGLKGQENKASDTQPDVVANEAQANEPSLSGENVESANRTDEVTKESELSQQRQASLDEYKDTRESVDKDTPSTSANESSRNSAERESSAQSQKTAESKPEASDQSNYEDVDDEDKGLA